MNNWVLLCSVSFSVIYILATLIRRAFSGANVGTWQREIDTTDIFGAIGAAVG